jgi:hypothetical protein
MPTNTAAPTSGRRYETSAFNKSLMAQLVEVLPGVQALQGEVSISLGINDTPVASILYANSKAAALRLNQYDPKATSLSAAQRKQVEPNSSKTTYVYRGDDLSEAVAVIVAHAADIEKRKANGNK